MPGVFKATRWPVIAAFLFLFGSGPLAMACGFKPSRTYVSLSAPVTRLMGELGLLEDPLLKGVSALHVKGLPNAKDIVADKLAGGVFLSPKVLQNRENAAVFFDESQELKRALEQSSVGNTVEIKTRGLDPFEANRAALGALSGYLKDCGNEIRLLNGKIKRIKNEVSALNFGKRPFVFYLGEFKPGRRPPEMVMANDGFVKFLKKSGMKSYPGELAYLPWSQKIMGRLDNPVLVGLEDGQKRKIAINKLGPGKFNISMNGSLSPGLGQIFFLDSLTNSQFFGRALEKEARGKK